MAFHNLPKPAAAAGGGGTMTGLSDTRATGPFQRPFFFFFRFSRGSAPGENSPAWRRFRYARRGDPAGFFLGNAVCALAPLDSLPPKRGVASVGRTCGC